MLVIVPRVLGQDLPEVLFTLDKQVVEALAPDPISGGTGPRFCSKLPDDDRRSA
jgi:hypothetical protein